ncbi:hypothetical protein FKX85_19600 [Echinicola soli]|uniref:Uncharacterized protein n=1 Tax=Echinicola soli TaxID=2591634 RepID=A0A514CMR7_9BACT|nr:hypothetical protein [Echinicola soli]QDH81115.1 hypothetical protein FKX85_19600 [Echinicola soli]
MNNLKHHLILWDGTTRDLIREIPDWKYDYSPLGILQKNVFKLDGQLLIHLLLDRSLLYRQVLKTWLERAGGYVYLLEKVRGNTRHLEGRDLETMTFGCFQVPAYMGMVAPESVGFPELASWAPENRTFPFMAEVFRFDSQQLYCLYAREIKSRTMTVVGTTNR